MKVKDILMMVKIYLTYDENYLSIGEKKDISLTMKDITLIRIDG